MKFATSDHVYRGATCEEMRAAIISQHEQYTGVDGDLMCIYCGSQEYHDNGGVICAPNCIVRRLEES